MSRSAIIARLKLGPATNAELQEAVIDHGAGIARDAAVLMRQGRVCRIDGGSGRGSRAVYALKEGRHAD
jgi:hypothetical protein